MKSRKKRQYGGNTLEQIRTGNRNIQVLRMRQMPKDPNKQGFGRKKNRRRMRGGAPPILVDKYGGFIRAF